MKKFIWPVLILAGILLIFFIFIPAFAGRLAIDPVIHLGLFNLRWYGVILATAILAAYFYIRKQAWRFGISQGDVDDYSFWVVILGILGARVYYVLFSWSYFVHNLSEIYQIWHGGISIYGGVLVVLLFTYFYARKKAYRFNQLFDLAACGLPLAQAIGRFGNFINQEAFGTPTSLPWKMYVEPAHRPVSLIQYNFFHPAFLYEAILDLAVFFVLRKLAGKSRSGLIGWTYLGLYSLGRFFVEGIRLDSFFLKGFRVDQLIAIMLVIISGIMIFRIQRKQI